MEESGSLRFFLHNIRPGKFILEEIYQTNGLLTKLARKENKRYVHARVIRILMRERLKGRNGIKKSIFWFDHLKPPGLISLLCSSSRGPRNLCKLASRASRDARANESSGQRRRSILYVNVTCDQAFFFPSFPSYRRLPPEKRAPDCRL